MANSSPATDAPEGRRLARKPRVLFLNTRSQLGADVAVHLTLLEHFDPDAVEAHIATNRNSVDLDKTLDWLHRNPNVRVTVLDLGSEMSGGPGGFAGKLSGIARNAGAMISLLRLAFYVVVNRIDVIHSGDRPRDAAFSTLLAKLTRRRSLIHVHIKWYREIGRATTWAAQSCTGVIAISEFVRQSLIDGGVPDAKIHTVLNATDAIRFDPAKLPSASLRAKFDIAPARPIVGIVARIMLWKGQLELVEALAIVKQSIANVALVIVGNEDHLAKVSAESYSGKVRSRIVELGLEANVIWAGWQDASAGVMADIDVLAVPSYEEPFGLVVTEGMAMERPVVGYRTGALPEIVEDAVEGILVEPHDANALADALVTLLNDPERRRELGRNGRKRVMRDFTPARQARDMEAVYRDVTARDGIAARSGGKQVSANTAK